MASTKQEFYCEKRACKTKKPETLSCMSGAGFAKDKVDTRWFCDTCFEEVNGDVVRKFKETSGQSGESEPVPEPEYDLGNEEVPGIDE